MGVGQDRFVTIPILLGALSLLLFHCPNAGAKSHRHRHSEHVVRIGNGISTEGGKGLLETELRRIVISRPSIVEDENNYW
jgi:hypothetical protein